MLLKLLPGLFLVTLVAVCGFALLKGGRTERSVAMACVIAAFLSLAAAFLAGQQWRAPEYGVLLVDLGLLAFLVVVALRSDRFWPLWACAFQLVAVVTHVAVMVDRLLLPQAYSLAQPFWAYPVLIALAIGTYNRSRASSDPAVTR